jgi:hypothetical protein
MKKRLTLNVYNQFDLEVTFKTHKTNAKTIKWTTSNSYEVWTMQGPNMYIKFEFCKKKHLQEIKKYVLLQSQAYNLKKIVFKNFDHAFEDCRSTWNQKAIWWQSWKFAYDRLKVY